MSTQGATQYVTCWFSFLVLSIIAWGLFCGTFSSHHRALAHVTEREEERHPALVAELSLYGVAGTLAFLVSCCCFHICMKDDRHLFHMAVEHLCGGVKPLEAGLPSSSRSTGSAKKVATGAKRDLSMEGGGFQRW